MLEYVSQYAPKALYRDITLRATSLSAVWILVRNWAGLKPLAVSSTYFTVKHSYDPSGDLTLTDFFFSIRNACCFQLHMEEMLNSVATFQQ